MPAPPKSVLYGQRFVFALLLLLLLLPALQAKFHFFEELTLGGAFQKAMEPELDWNAVQKNTYQPAMEQYMEEKLGFRSLLIRTRNQLSFSLFRLTRSDDVIAGRNKVLFEPRQIKSYAGLDRMAEKDVRFYVRRVRAVQRALAKRGVQLLFVMAPNKARFQPEDLPTSQRPAPGTVTNYDMYIKALKADTVNLLDMVPVFEQWKKTSPYPLFPRGGTHWSGYGATLAADTLLRRLEQLGGLQFPAVRTVGPPRIVRSADSLRATDNDLAGLLNLLQPVETPPMAYRRLAFDPPKPSQTRPSALFVGDSFTWGLVHFGPYILREFAEDTRVWYYGYGVRVPDSLFSETGNVSPNLNLQEQVESRKFVVLFMTEHNLPTHEFDFTNRAYNIYYPPTPADTEAIEAITAQLTQRAYAQNPDSVWKAQTADPNGYKQRMHAQAEHIHAMQTFR